MTATKAFPLIDGHYCDEIRTKDTHLVQYGAIERGLKATGRARCRCCGERIAKGADEVRFYWDFTGSGSWTAVECHIHAAPCEPGKSEGTMKKKPALVKGLKRIHDRCAKGPIKIY